MIRTTRPPVAPSLVTTTVPPGLAGSESGNGVIDKGIGVGYMVFLFCFRNGGKPPHTA